MCHVLVIEDDWLIADHVALLAEQAVATSVAQADGDSDAIAAACRQRPEVLLSDVREAVR